MKGKLLSLVTTLLFLSSGFAWAQTGTVTGTVRDADSGESLPGASVVIGPESLLMGAATDINGKFVIRAVPAGTHQLKVSFVGFEDHVQEVSVTAGATVSLDISLSMGALELATVAVTALGFRVNRDQVGTSSSNVSGNSLVRSGESSVLKGLSAKAAGVNVTSSGGDPGTGGRIVIRGESSISGGNQPLIVVDGIPMDNSTRGAGTGGVQQQSRLNDINPNDIESMEVLKGAAAAALYGSRAQSGVIVITTKGGNPMGRMDVSFQSSIGTDHMNQMVPLQTTFGQGTNGLFRSGFSRTWGDIIADREGGADVATGTAISVGDQTGTQYPALANGDKDNPHGGKRSTDIFDHTDELFKTGTTFDNTLNISGGDAKSRYYLSIANTAQDGIIKDNSNYMRTSVRINAERSLSDKLSVGATANFVRTNSDRIQQGSNTSGLLLGALRTPADYDNEDYTVTYYPNGFDGLIQTERHRSYRNPLGASDGPGYDNPFFIINKNRDNSLVNRITGKVNATYTPMPWLNLTGRIGLDTYEDRRSIYFPIYTATNISGRLTEQDYSFYGINTDLIAQANRTLTDDIDLGVTLGFNFNHREWDDLTGGITSFSNTAQELRSLTNTKSENSSPGTEQAVRRTAGNYAEFDFSFYEQLFVKLTGRLDYASTFGPEAKNSFFYPSVSVAWQFSDLIPNAGPLSFGKLRASLAQVGREPNPYGAYTYFENATFSDGFTGTTLNASAYGNGGIQRDETQGNPEIKPETKTEYEAGLDLRFLNDRVSFGSTVYFNKSDDLIFNVDVPSSTGYWDKQLNAGKTENKGIELSLDAAWVNTATIGWNTYVNWWTNDNTVTDLMGVEEIGMNGFTETTSSLVYKKPFGVLYGGRWRRDSFEPLTDSDRAAGLTVGNDGLVLTNQGFPIGASTEGVLGDPNADWRASFGNRLRYKGVSLDILFDIKQGGQVWNGTKGALFNFGTHGDQDWFTTISAAEAAQLKNYDGRTLIDMINRGEAGTIKQNSDGTYSFRGYVKDFGAGPVLIDEKWFVNGPGSGFTGPAEDFVEDGSYIRLREVTLSYNWNAQALRRLGLQSVDLSLTGRNLWLSTDYSGIDPETNLTGPSNGSGLDYFNNPNTQSYRFSVRLNY